MNAITAYALSKGYTDESLIGGGAVAGKNCTISSITETTGGHRVTFSWTLDNGTVKTGTMDVKDGADGEDGANGSDGLGIKDVEIDSNNHLILTFDDDTTKDAGEIATVKGDDGAQGEKGDTGFSPTITVKESTPEKYTLEITNEDGSFVTPNLKGGGSGSASAMSDLEDVALTSLSNGQILKYNSASGKWVNANGVEIEKLSDIEDVDLTSLKDGQVIVWDATNEKWVNADAPNVIQLDNMGNAGDYPQRICQYVGSDTANYKRGYWYRSNPHVESGSVVYTWEQIDVQPGNKDYEELDNLPSVNGTELKGAKSLDDLDIQKKMQVTTLPTATAANAGTIYQFIGDTTTDYRRGFFYQSSYDADTAGYKWVQIDVSSNSALAARIATLETNQGDISDLEVTGVSDLVSAINAVNNKGLKSIVYTEPNLIITYQDDSTYNFNVRDSILLQTQLGELANVTDTAIANTNVLQYDSAITGYKPYDIVAAMSNLLQSAKDYTDNQIASTVQDDALYVDDKPVCSYDSGQDKYVVVYYQGGAVHTTEDTTTRFYYVDANDDPYCTSWFITGVAADDPVEFSYLLSSVNLETFVSKETDVVSTYTEDAADKSKVPNLAALDALLTIVKTSLALKVNTSDVIDNLTSSEDKKPLSAKQGKELKDLVDAKQNVMQYATLPTADSALEGIVAQYVGVSSQAYDKGSFYICTKQADDTYAWVLKKYAADVDDSITENGKNPVEGGAIYDALEEKQPKTLSAPIEINGTQYTTVESAIAAILALANLKQNTTLATPITVDGTAQETVESALAALADKTVDVDGSTIVKDDTTGELKAVTATETTVGVVKPDGSTITVDSDGTIHGADQTDLSAYETSWSGTKAAWESLTDEQRSAYVLVSFTDDGDTSEVVDAVTDGDMRAPTANAVYDALQGINAKRLTVTASESSTTNTIDLTRLGLNANTDYEIIVTGITGKHIKTIMRTTVADYTGTSQTWGWCFGNAISVEGDSAMSMSCSSSGVLTVTGGVIYGNIYVACKPFINGIPQ